MELRKEFYEFVASLSGGKARLPPKGETTNLVSD
jgi:hypothetical protein